MVVYLGEMLIWPFIHRQIRSFFCTGNAARAFAHAVECIDFSTTFPQQFRNQHAASNLTDTQDRICFLEKGWCGVERATQSQAQSFWTVWPIQDQSGYRNNQCNSMSNGKQAGGRPRTLHAATDEEEGRSLSWTDGQPITHSSLRQVFRLSQKPDVSLALPFHPQWSPRFP